MTSSLTLGVLCVCLMIGTAWTFRLPQSCTGPQDCLHDECCVVGMQRYSVPICQKLGQIGDTCRPYNTPENRTLWYPYNGGVQQKNSATYTLLCPCAGGLHCTAAQCQPATLGDQVGNDLAGIYDEYQ
ncbi:astakine-like [Dermacentor andersoni]|uniref:astakine-like n=1 Tax=Dermacentor andersoni TaxID=34620 RepID=UPI0021552D06